MDVDILIEVTGVADFASHGDEVLQGFGDGVYGVKGKDEAKNQSDKGTNSGDEKADVIGLVGGVGRFLGRLADLLGGLIENDGGFLEPGAGIFLEVEDLKIGNGCVAGIDLVAFGKEGLGKIIRPTGFSGFDLLQRGAQGIGACLGLTVLDEVGHGLETFVDPILVARIATKQEIVKVETIQHDLITHGLDGAYALKSHGGLLARRGLLEPRQEVGHQEEDQNAQNETEAQVKSLANRHEKKPPARTGSRARYY